MGMGKFLLAVATLFSFTAFADAIVKGKSSAWCKVEVLENEPFQASGATPVSFVTPSEVPDLSGEWQAGCYWAVVKSEKTTPTGEGIYSKNTVFPENVWTKADLQADPKLVPWHKVTITQDGWRSLKFMSETKKGPFHGAFLDFQNQLNYQGRIKFVRECKSDAHSWRRTYDMPLRGSQTARWSAEGDRFWGTEQVDGNEAKYTAQYLALYRSLFTIERDRILVKTAFWTEHLRYNPPGFNAFPYDFGGRICVLKRAK